MRAESTFSTSFLELVAYIVAHIVLIVALGWLALEFREGSDYKVFDHSRPWYEFLLSK